MKNLELQKLLAQYPDNMPIKLLLNCHDINEPVVDFDDENIIHTSETAYCDEEAPEEEWDTEYGKVELGDGQRYLLINPMIV